MADTTIDDVMKAYAVDAVAAAARREIDLDFSEASLDLVDELLGRECFVGPTPRTPASLEDEETLWVLAKCFGAYVGEVTIRCVGGHWVGDATDDGGIRPAIEVQGVKGFPVDKVWKRMTESEYSGLGGYCRVLRAIIEHQSKET
jgi:hypothetical protein